MRPPAAELGMMMGWGAVVALVVAVAIAAAIGALIATLALRREIRAAPPAMPPPAMATSPPIVAVGAPVASAAPPVPAAAAAAVAHADSDAERDAFVSIVSHDLRAPLRVVEGFTKIVKEDYAASLDPAAQDHLDRVLGATVRMHAMIDALLALSRLSSQPLERVPMNLSQLAGYVVEDLRRQEPGRQVDVEIEPDLLATGDPTLLRTVLENLLGNAWKYTRDTAGARIAFIRRGTHGTNFSVEDNGAGFDMRYAERLFGVFQRLHSASEFPGTGVGLASVRRIVRRHGGDIHAEAEPARGARFHFSLPVDGAGAAPRRH